MGGGGVYTGAAWGATSGATSAEAVPSSERLARYSANDSAL
eukprot:CAMPEP_0181233982 /NCGR_PEP_ID=MMETSP1096-20121128/36675_1 /TAXON_ID=156174 ORGANISM="Chrysochromulina ericina, Strain CCMP281" /NCGR_SAMPLE_ID=MMETSP1096 /ASSEMBLY_ACC=CAM_ASM_000453 /LENGTH=40 /DNA_ID= /DNA_START= /DNA_END= /DNA_ORIENTATION=